MCVCVCASLLLCLALLNSVCVAVCLGIFPPASVVSVCRSGAASGGCLLLSLSLSLSGSPSLCLGVWGSISTVRSVWVSLSPVRLFVSGDCMCASMCVCVSVCRCVSASVSVSVSVPVSQSFRAQVRVFVLSAQCRCVLACWLWCAYVRGSGQLCRCVSLFARMHLSHCYAICIYIHKISHV